MGAKPIIAGYENQIIEFSVKHHESWPRVRDKIRILYPIPTVWSSHPIIILNTKENVLIEALKDPEIQRLAWEKHGFRSGLPIADNSFKIVDNIGIPKRIEKVVSMPSPDVMERILNYIHPQNKKQLTYRYSFLFLF